MKLTQNQLIILRRRLEGRASRPFLPRAISAVLGWLPRPIGKHVAMAIVGVLVRMMARQGYTREDLNALIEVASERPKGDDAP